MLGFAIVSGTSLDVYKENEYLKAEIAKNKGKDRKHSEEIQAMRRLSEEHEDNLRNEHAVALRKETAKRILETGERDLKIETLRQDLALAKLQYDNNNREIDLEVNERSQKNRALDVERINDLTTQLAVMTAKFDSMTQALVSSNEVTNSVREMITAYRADFAKVLEKLPNVDLKDLSISVEVPANRKESKAN